MKIPIRMNSVECGFGNQDNIRSWMIFLFGVISIKRKSIKKAADAAFYFASYSSVILFNCIRVFDQSLFAMSLGSTSPFM